MLRVNLLPTYIYDKQRKAKFVVLWGVGLAAVIVGMVAYAGSVQSVLTADNNHRDQAKQYQDTWNKADSDIAAVKQSIATTKAKQDFIASAQTYNSAWPKVYEAMGSVTSPDIVLKTMAVDAGNHHSLHLTGFCPSEMQLARWWMSLRNDVGMFDNVYISLPTHPYAPGGGNGGGRGGFGGGGFNSAAAASKASIMGSMGGGSMPAGMGSSMMGMGGGGGAAGSSTETMLEGRRGLDFVASVTVNDKLAPPTGAPAWPAGGGGGGGMMGGGMMGGSMMSGMPPSMGGGMSGGPMGGGGRMPMSSGAGAPSGGTGKAD